MGFKDKFNNVIKDISKAALDKTTDTIDNKLDNMGKKSKATKISELENEIIYYKKQIDELGGKEYSEIQNLITKSKKSFEQINYEIGTLKSTVDSLNNEITNLNEIIKSKRMLITDLDDEIAYQEFGLYKPKYSCMNSEEYAEQIKQIRIKQKTMIKEKKALSYSDTWTLDGSKAKGRAMNNDNMKMVLRAFNNECDVLISKVKFNNVDKIENQIYKVAEQIDKLNSRNKISILNKYITLKIEELHLVHEYAVKKQEEKETLREQRAKEREEAKLQKEIEEARKVFIKEQTHYNNALEKLLSQLANTNESNKQELEKKINETKDKLAEIEKGLEDIDYREANKKAGYVYIISNIGAFGEDVYKIGMTRRLEPQDRVDELGDASVPFKFDVHAMIFSDNAPKLEAALHQAFDDKKLNMINNSKEFFKVKLDEIEKVVKENHDKLIEFVKFPDAEQYRESIILRNMKKEI